MRNYLYLTKNSFMNQLLLALFLILSSISMSAFAIDVANTVHFSVATYAFNELDGNITIEVTRDSSLGGGAVDYATSDGTATADLDYTAVSGTLTFTDGQTVATFTVPILKDSELEGDETVLLNLSNPSNGVVFGSPASAELTIHDAKISMRDYFPLTPGGEWKYTANDKIFSVKVPFESVTLNMTKTRALKNMLNGSKYYYSNDASGLQLHRLSIPPINIPGLGNVSVLLSASPAIRMAAEQTLIVNDVFTQGSFRAVIPGVGSFKLPYDSHFAVLGQESITVPAGSFDVIKFQGDIIATFADTDISIREVYYLAKDIGIVKQEISSSYSDVVSILELEQTNIGIHDIAVTAITVPGKVALTAKTQTITKTVKVTVQNRSPLLETITDIDTLKKFVDLKVESLGACTAPIAQLLADKIQKRLPISLKPKETLVVDYALTVNCTNDPQANTPKNTGHEDYRYIATVNHSALDGKVDVHQDDDVCPRTVIAPYIVDTYPDNKIKDRGCGAKKPDKTFGADVITDVVGP